MPVCSSFSSWLFVWEGEAGRQAEFFPRHSSILREEGKVEISLLRGGREGQQRRRVRAAKFLPRHTGMQQARQARHSSSAAICCH